MRRVVSQSGAYAGTRHTRNRRAEGTGGYCRLCRRRCRGGERAGLRLVRRPVPQGLRRADFSVKREVTCWGSACCGPIRVCVQIDLPRTWRGVRALRRTHRRSRATLAVDGFPHLSVTHKRFSGAVAGTSVQPPAIARPTACYRSQSPQNQIWLRPLARVLSTNQANCGNAVCLSRRCGCDSNR